VPPLAEELTRRGYSASARDNYRLQTQRLLKWLRRDPETATGEEFINAKRVAKSFLNKN